MSLADSVLSKNDDLPIRTSLPVHSGKVRSVYWLNDVDSQRLISQKNYPVPLDTPLAIMVISDRLSAFDCIWHASGGLKGVPGKGAALNAISNHWFSEFKKHGLADSHILDIPHPFVWIVQKARPVMIEAIARQYITGSMWRAYETGERNFCGISLPEGLTRDGKLPELLMTPSTKGILKGIPNVPEQDDVNISRSDIIGNYAAFNFKQESDVMQYERLLKEGFDVISASMASHDQIFVDTKFEFGYVTDIHGNDKLIYMDEVGTPDSSRIWDGAEYRRGNIIEKSKEGFRQSLLKYVPDPDVLLNKNRMSERFDYAKHQELPEELFMSVSNTYLDIGKTITGQAIDVSDNPQQELLDVLSEQYQLIT